MAQKIASRTFEFGKVDWNHIGRKINAVDVEVTLYQCKSGPELAISADVWNNIHTDCICCGQCLDTILQNTALGFNDLFMELHELWRKYHLNDMRAGTPVQEAYLDGYVQCKRGSSRRHLDYDDARCILEEADLLTVEYNGEPYTYGHGWIYHEIPETDLRKIYKLLELDYAE